MLCFTLDLMNCHQHPGKEKEVFLKVFHNVPSNRFPFGSRKLFTVDDVHVVPKLGSH